MRGHDQTRSGGETSGGEIIQRSPGKRALTENLVQRRAATSTTPVTATGSTVPAPVDDPFGFQLVQRRGAGGDDADTHAIAAEGVRGAGSAMPHGAQIAASFGKYGGVVDGISAHVGGGAATASAAIGAEAYATGNAVAFAAPPDLGLAAHEAAHVVQQQHGVQLKGGVGQADDPHEQHADMVAERVVAGGSAEGLLDELAGSGTASAAIQRKDGPAATGAKAGREGSPDGVYSGVSRVVATPKTWLVSNPSLYTKTLVAKLDKGEKVELVDPGAGEKFNQTDPRYKWHKVKVYEGAHTGQEGWVMAGLLGSLLDVKAAGTIGATDKVGDGTVTVTTGQTVEFDGAAFGDNMFSMQYEGKDADKMRWLQFIWREVIGLDDKGAATPVTGTITTSGGTYDLTQGGTKDKAGTPAKNNYNTDTASRADPFYEAGFAGDRTADSATIYDQPYGATDKAKTAFTAGAKSAIARAHFSTFLVKDEKEVQYQTYVDIQWDYAKVEDTDAPPKGKHTVSGSGTVDHLPATIAERLHDQFPATKDLK